jgi:hypothetical protein
MQFSVSIIDDQKDFSFWLGESDQHLKQRLKTSRCASLKLPQHIGQMIEQLVPGFAEVIAWLPPVGIIITPNPPPGVGQWLAIYVSKSLGGFGDLAKLQAELQHSVCIKPPRTCLVPRFKCSIVVLALPFSSSWSHLCTVASHSATFRSSSNPKLCPGSVVIDPFLKQQRRLPCASTWPSQAVANHQISAPGRCQQGPQRTTQLWTSPFYSWETSHFYKTLCRTT